jgi:hypothetical protein
VKIRQKRLRKHWPAHFSKRPALETVSGCCVTRRSRFATRHTPDWLVISRQRVPAFSRLKRICIRAASSSRAHDLFGDANHVTTRCFPTTSVGFGVKVFGPDLREVGRLEAEVERVAHTVSGTTSAFAERLSGDCITRLAGLFCPSEPGSGAI